MASTAKPPDPMQYALAAFLLPASRGPCVHARACILGPYLYTGCARVACVGGGSRGNSMGAGGRCLVPRVVGVRWSGPGTVLLAARRPCQGGVRVGVWGAGRRCVFQMCGVRCVWTLGLVRRPVALSGLLLWWQSRAFGCSCVGGGWVEETFLTIRSLRVARS